MKLHRLMSAAAVATLLALSIAAVPAAARERIIPATGTFTTTSFALTDPRPVQGGTLFKLDATATVSGTLVGSSKILFGTCFFDLSGKATCAARELFTGSAVDEGGQTIGTGTLTFLERINIDSITGASSGSAVSVGGTGGLKDVRAQLTFQNDQYSGRLISGS